MFDCFFGFRENGEGGGLFFRGGLFPFPEQERGKLREERRLDGLLGLAAAWARDSRDSEAVASSLGEAVITQQQLSGQPNTHRTGEFERGYASC